MTKPVVWSETAKEDLMNIKSFYNERNGSDAYSKKLLKKFKESARFIERYPMGSKLFEGNVRGIVVAEYILFFQLPDAHILLLTVWDGRRDPKQLLKILRKD